MAVQFPNFLSAQLVKPDYSGIGDALQNVLAGYEGSQRPKQLQQEAEARQYDNMIKAIQAKFAEPTAQAHLNQLRLQGQKAQQEAQQEELFRKLLAGEAVAPPGQTQGQQQSEQPSPLNYEAGGGMPLYREGAQSAPAMGQQSQTAQQNPLGGAPEQVVSQGSPHLYNVDKMYDEQPLSRAFLEKKGLKKKQDVKFDAKTGQTTVMTTWPSGKITVQTLGSIAGTNGQGDNMPLTTAARTLNQNMVGAVTNAIPLVDKLASFNTPVKGIPWTQADNKAKYESLTNQLSDQLMTALNLPKTNESLNLVKSMTQRHFMESDKAYHARMRALKEDLNARKKYAQGALKGGVKVSETVKVTEDDPLGLF